MWFDDEIFNAVIVKPNQTIEPGMMVRSQANGAVVKILVLDPSNLLFDGTCRARVQHIARPTKSDRSHMRYCEHIARELN